MTEELWEKVKQIFGEALERQPAEREAYVREAAKGEPELLSEVLLLLAENDRDSGLLSRPALAGARTPSREERPRFAPDSVLARRFRIVRFIARGGMGEVYEAEDLELNERVALKAIRRRIAPDADLHAMFKREIQLARRVTHPNVCRIFDLAQHEDPENGELTLLLSMELIAGQTLAEHLRLNGPLEFRAAQPWIDDIAEGLQAVHDAGIVHGDLKPGNIMLVSRPGEARIRAIVMDFGMALPVVQQSAGSGDNPTATSPDWVLRGGTPEYFAPEQTKGHPATTATDVYSLALVIGEMLGMPRSIRVKPDAERMTSRCARVLRRCLEADPERRYSRPADMAEALRKPGDPRARMAMGAAAVLALAAIVITYFAARPVDTLRGTGSRLILTEKNEEVWSQSPDGRYLAISSYDPENLILRDVRTGKSSRVAGGVGRCWAIFSPDGNHLAFVKTLNRIESELHVIGADGSGERILFRNPEARPYPLDWSPDGKHILVRLDRRDMSSQLASVSTVDGSVQVLSVPKQAWLNRVLFAEDGSGIVFTTRGAADSRSEIHKLSRNGAESTVVGAPGSNWLIGWSPDRRRLVFFSDRKGQPGIWSISVSGDAVNGEAREVAPNVGRWTPLGISRTGSLMYRNEADSQDVYTAVLDLPAGRTISSPRPVMDQFLGSYSYPNWSQDGRRLVFDSTHGQPAVVVYEPSAGSRRELPIDLARSMRPQWSAHGAAIMVVGRSQNGEDGQYKVDPATGNANLFMTRKDLEAAYEGAWSPDGKVYFNRYVDWRRGIFRLNAETRERQVIYVPPAGVDLGTENLALSPDGRTLAFHARNDAAKTAALMLVPAEGGEAKALLTIHAPERFLNGSFTWTPDSRRLLAARTNGEVSEIWQVPVDGAAPAKIDFPYKLRILYLRLNPDGKTIAFTKLDYRSEIWMLQNFL